MRSWLIIPKNPFRPASIRFCVIDGGSSQRKNTFCNAAKLPVNIITAMSRISNTDGDGGGKIRGGCGFTSSSKPETQSRSFCLIKNKSQTNSMILGSERSFWRQRDNFWTFCLLFHLFEAWSWPWKSICQFVWGELLTFVTCWRCPQGLKLRTQIKSERNQSQSSSLP